MTTNIHQYLLNGCMRCKYGGTSQCKINFWRTEVETLRQIVLDTGLKEEMKWGIPVYTLNGKNILSISALKPFANVSFFKGVLLNDKHNILQQQGNLQSDRLIQFTHVNDIIKWKDALVEYIHEAKSIEEKGLKVEFKKNPEPIPQELLNAFTDDPTFEKAFESLTLSKQRGYIIHFSQPKQSLTRVNRIQKYKEHIFSGIGLNDKYKS